MQLTIIIGKKQGALPPAMYEYTCTGFNHQAIIGKKQRDLPPAMYVYTCTYTMVLTTRPPLTPLNDDAPFNSEVLSSALFVVCRFSILVVLYLFS